MVFIQEASHAFPLARWRSAIRRTIESVENRHEIYFAQFPHELSFKRLCISQCISKVVCFGFYM